MLDVICTGEHYSSHFHIRKWYINFTDDAVALKFVTPPPLTTQRVLTRHIHTQIPLGWLLEQECGRERVWLPYSCTWYTWESWDPRMLPWYAGMVGTKERWRNGTWSWPLVVQLSASSGGSLWGQCWFSWHQHSWGGELGPLNRIIRTRNPRRIPLNVSSTISKDFQAILVFGNHRGKWFQKP